MLSQQFNLTFDPFCPQALVYEMPGFEGSCLEIDSEVFSFGDGEGDDVKDGTNQDSRKLHPVGSVKIIGGLYVFVLLCHILCLF